jgi:hypothetical protein
MLREENMNSRPLWDQEQEKIFFNKYLEVASPEQLFYVTNNNKYVAYWPKNYADVKATLQSRNSLIGTYTEKWVADLINEIAEEAGGFAINNVISESIGLSNQSPADVAICRTKNNVQNPKDILTIIEVKMSIVWNWEFNPINKTLTCLGDYRTHQGNPGLLRSDTMLKAIGKSINIRVSGFEASKIPIIIIGNTPITKSYYEKVDYLKRNGIIQGFWSVNPKPLDNNGENIKSTKFNGFYRFDTYEELKQRTLELLKEEREFFSGMHTRRKLGEIIEIANKESTYETKAQKFLDLLRRSED